MRIPRRQFLHLMAGAAGLPALSHFAWAQAYPTTGSSNERDRTAVGAYQR
jgi:hypothetical protein